MKRIDFSVVIPVMNEEENVTMLYRRTTEAVQTMSPDYEIIFVDDGSSDKTYQILKSLHEQDRRLKIVKFRSNFGQSAAMAAGFERAKGKVVISMDGDLQNDPADIPRMVDKLDEGYDIVAGWRKNRKDKLIIRKIPSKIANKLVRKLTGVDLHDTGCSLKVYRAEIIHKIRLYGEMHRFIPALARMEGARIAEMVVSHHARQYGQSKYNISRTFRVIMDLTTLNLFIKYLTRPIHFFGPISFVFNFLGLMTLLIFGFFVIKQYDDAASMNVLISTSFLFIAAGCQFLFLGLLANMVIKTGNKNRGKLMDYFQVRD